MCVQPLHLSPSLCSHLIHRKVSQGQMTAIPAYSYPGIVSGLPVDQSGLRPAYPFMIPGQYVQVPYHPAQVRESEREDEKGEEGREVWIEQVGSGKYVRCWSPSGVVSLVSATCATVCHAWQFDPQSKHMDMCTCGQDRGSG